MSMPTSTGGASPNVPANARTQLAVLTFTDVVDSTDLKRRFGMRAYSHAIQRHNTIFEETGREFAGMQIVKYTGDGYFATFSTVADAVRFALLFQHRMRTEPWGELQLTTRLGLHVGEVAVMEVSGKGDIIGLAADLAARLMSLAVGGQILLTRMAFDDARQFLAEHPPIEPGHPAPGLRWLAHGPYLFKGAEDPIEVYEVGAEGVAPLTAPPDSEKVKRQVHGAEEPTLGWRPAVGMPVPSRPNWLLEGKIGEGGFGEVWLAEHQTTKARHVFKFCFDAERLRSFKRELTIFRLIKAALGDREDIVRLHEVKFDEPPFFLESDFSAEGNLCQWAEKVGGIGNVPMEERIDILIRVAKALAAAHSIGVLHKDIKPANILMQVDRSGKARPQLVDFGISAISNKAALAAQNLTVASSMETLGEDTGSSGTPVYMPPEAMAGLAWTEQGDIFSLGVVFYQVIAGDLTRPLAGGWERDIADELLRADIAECVDGNRAYRLQSASELAVRLEQLPERRSERAKMAANAKKLARARRVTLQLAALLMLLVALAGAWGWKTNARLISLKEEQQRQVAAGRLAQRASRYLESSNDPAAAALLYTESLAMKQANGKLQDEVSDRRRIGCALRAMPRLVAAHSLDRMDGFQLDPTGKCAVVSSRSEYRPASAGSGPARNGEAQLWFFDGRGIVPLQVTLENQPGAKISIIRAAFDASGEHVAAAAEYSIPEDPTDRKIRGVLFVWKVEDGGASPRRPILAEAFTEPLRDIAFHPVRPELLALARRSGDGEPGSRGAGHVSLYDWKAKNVLANLPHEFPVSRVIFSSDGRRLATASGDPNATATEGGGECQLLDLEKPGAAPRVLWHQEPVNCVSFDRSGDRVVTGSGLQNGFYGDAQVWNAETGAAIGVPFRHGGAVMVAEFAPDGDRVLTGSQRDGKARIWNSGSPYPLHVFSHDAHVFSAAWSPDGRYVATGSRDQAARVWDTASGELAAPVLNHGGTVNHVRFSREGRDLFAVTIGTARQWDLASPGAPVAQQYGQARVMSASPDGAWFAVATEEDSFQQSTDVQIINATTGGQRWKKALTVPGMVRHLAFSPDGAHLAIASERRPTATGPRGEVRFCNVETGEGPRLRLEGAAVFAALSGGTTPRALILSKGPDRKISRVTVWDANTDLQRHWTQPDFPIECAAISADGSNVVTAGGSTEPRRGQAFVLAVNPGATGEPLTLLAKVEHDEAVRAVAFNNTGSLLATGAVDDEARVWDLRGQGRLIGKFKHTADLTSVGFYQGGARLLSTSFDGTAVAWDVATGAKLGTCRHKAVVRTAVANADGTYIVTGGDDQSVRVWDGKTFEAIAILSQPSAIQSVGFCASADRVFGAGLLMHAGADRLGNRPDVLNIPLGRVDFRSWDFSPDPRDIATLRAEGQRLASRALTAGEQTSMLTQLEVADRKALLPPPMSAPAHSPEEIAQYHRDEAGRCLAGGQWSAAAWHAERLIAARDGDYGLKLRSFFRANAWDSVLQDRKAALAFHNGSDDSPELRRIIALALSEQARPGDTEEDRKAMAAAWNEVFTREPNDTFLLLKKAEICLRSEQYEEARRALESAVEKEREEEGGSRLSAWQRLALLYVGDESRRAEYDKLCADLLKRFGSVAGYGAIVAWPRLLRPLDAADPTLAGQLIALARAAVSEERSNPYRLNTLGAALVRAGKFAEAIETLDLARRSFHRGYAEVNARDVARAERFFDPEECKALSPEQGRPIDWIFLALANRGLGKDQLAGKWLRYTQDALQSQDTAANPYTSNRRVWNDLELQILLKEATAAMPAIGQ